MLFLPRLTSLLTMAFVYSEHCARLAIERTAQLGVLGTSDGAEAKAMVMKGLEEHSRIYIWFCQQLPELVRRRRSQNAFCSSDVLLLVHSWLSLQVRIPW